MEEIRPIPVMVGNRCACTPDNFCLWHYGKLTIPERRAVRAQLGILGTWGPDPR